MIREDYIRLLESVDPIDGSIAFSRIWDIVHNYLIDYPESTIADYFDGYIDLDTANEMMKKAVNDGCDVLYMHEFAGDIEFYDEFFLVGKDDVLLHIGPEEVRGLRLNLLDHIKYEIAESKKDKNNE